MRNQLLDCQISEICRRYQAGESASSLARAFSVNHETICNRLTWSGIKLRSHKESAALTGNLSQHQIAEMASLYRSGSTTPQLASRYKIKPQSISYHLKKQGVELRERPEARRKHTLNEAAFDSLNEEGAYWIGFLMADGCVHKRNGASPRISIALARCDIEHLEAFKMFLGASNPIHIDGNCACFSVSSNKLSNSIARYGITPRKSLTAKVIDLEQSKDFWRGVIDGDGSLSDIQRYSDLKTKHRTQLSLLGSQALMEQFSLFVQSIANFKPKTFQLGNIFTVVIRGATAAQVVTALYADCSIALPRKLKRAKRIIEDSKNIAQRKCLRCGHVWFPNANNQAPKTCSKCRSQCWNISKPQKHLPIHNEAKSFFNPTLPQ
jgi:hypothetical protein